MEKIRKRESSALISSLSSGVVPRIGLRHIAVGRKNEVDAFLRDLSVVEDGGASFRFVCGSYGSGKSFLLQMIRNNAMERGFAVADADLSPERRLTGTQGQGLATYRELLQHMSTLTRPEGGGLESILQKWLGSRQSAVHEQIPADADQALLIEEVSTDIENTMQRLTEMAYGFSFTKVLTAYWRGIRTGNDQLRQDALRWLRGEFTTKTEARNVLGVDRIIDDASWYDFLKLFARFVTMAGYKGLLIFIDEGINLYKISHKQSRENNYEKLLTIFNDIMQGKASGIGFFMSGTPQFIYDERRGLFSYEALRSRLADHRFAALGYTDYSGPVIRLDQLTPEEMYLLLERLCFVHGSYYDYDCVLSEQELTAFLNSVVSRMGADALLTPREVTRDFLGLLNILHQNPGTSFETLMQDPAYAVRSAEKDPEQADEEDDLFKDFDI